MEKSVTENAYAKINLGLDVLRKREDGYHDVKMVMQTIGIKDELVIATDDDLVGVTMTSDAKNLPSDDTNLVIKAAKLMIEKYEIDQGIRIELKKSIPVAAGMAGGSADAAATLRGINRLFGIGATLEELGQLGVQIGADVPYCVLGGTYLAEGIGDKLTKLPDVPTCSVLVAKPAFGVSTKHVYESLNLESETNHPDMDTVIDCVKNGDLGGMAFNMENILERVTKEEHPVIAELETIMINHGALNSLMSGSGPTVFGLFDSKANAERAAVEIRKLDNLEAVIVTSTEDMSHEEIRRKARVIITSSTDGEEPTETSFDCIALENRGIVSVTYKERDPQTNKSIQNKLTISDKALIYSKTGAIRTEMVITPYEATTQLYQTEFGDIELNIICHDYVLEESAERMVLTLDYDLMQSEGVLSHFDMNIQIDFE